MEAWCFFAKKKFLAAIVENHQPIFLYFFEMRYIFKIHIFFKFLMNIVGSSEKCYFEEFMTDHLKRCDQLHRAGIQKEKNEREKTLQGL
jgi:hypothetical protein